MNESSRKTRPKSQVMMPNASTSPVPSHSRKNGSSDSLPSHRYENEWEMRKKELSELKARSAQMEKTMRWWSDCTDNWRKKWSEMKTERNEAREELKATKLQLSQIMKQLDGSQLPTDLKTKPSKTAQADVRIYSNIDQPPSPLPRTTSVAGSTKKAYPQSQPHHPHPGQSKCSLTDNGILYKPCFAFPQSSKHKYETEHQNPNGQRHFQSQKTKVTRRVQTDLSGSGISVLDRELVSLLEEKVSHLRFKLDEVTTRLAIERQEKAHLIHRVERLQRELGDLSDLYESVKKELCEINGKEFTESEIESFADEREDIEDLGLESDGEENRLIEQLAHDDEEEVDETDKHTPTAEMNIHKCDLSGCEEGHSHGQRPESGATANGDGDGSSDTSSIKDTTKDPSVEASPQNDRKFSSEAEIEIKETGISEGTKKTLNESLSIDEDMERKVHLLNGQLKFKAINFQEENHEKLDLRCFADLTEPVVVSKIESEVPRVKCAIKASEVLEEVEKMFNSLHYSENESVSAEIETEELQKANNVSCTTDDDANNCLVVSEKLQSIDSFNDVDRALLAETTIVEKIENIMPVEYQNGSASVVNTIDDTKDASSEIPTTDL